MYTPFWFNQIDILYDKNYLLEIFPVKEYDLIRKLNAVFRFSIYYSLIVYFYNRSTNMFAVPIITALVTYAIWYKHKDIQVNNMQNQLKNDVPVTADPYNYNCNLPTRNNPFMNPSFMDVSADKPLPKACSSYDNKGVQRRMETNLIKDFTEIIPIFLGKKIHKDNFSLSQVGKVFQINPLLLSGYTKHLERVKKELIHWLVYQLVKEMVEVKVFRHKFIFIFFC